jgi:hypothetical protein
MHNSAVKQIFYKWRHCLREIGLRVATVAVVVWPCILAWLAFSYTRWCCNYWVLSFAVSQRVSWLCVAESGPGGAVYLQGQTLHRYPVGVASQTIRASCSETNPMALLTGKLMGVGTDSPCFPSLPFPSLPLPLPASHTRSLVIWAWAAVSRCDAMPCSSAMRDKTSVHTERAYSWTVAVYSVNRQAWNTVTRENKIGLCNR